MSGIGVSLDQAVGERVGVFARFGWQDDEAVVDHEALASGGVVVRGGAWGRQGDRIGLAYAYLDGAAGGDIEHTQAIEAYLKLRLTEFSDLSFDLQFLDEELRSGEERDGPIYGVRINAYF